MHTLRKIVSCLLLCYGLSSTAQTIDINQTYEIHTTNGLALDNQESVDAGSKIFIAKRVAGKESHKYGNSYR